MPDQITVETYNRLTSELRSLGFQELKRLSKSQDIGRWDCNNEMTIVVTAGVGTVSTSKGRVDDPRALEIIHQLCPKGRGGLVTASLLDLLDPNRDPEEEAEYASTD